MSITSPAAQVPRQVPARQAGAELRAALRDAADSVFAYLERTAEAVPGGVRWQTMSFDGEPHYSGRLYNGVTGISLFLADYHAVTGSARALELAEQAVRWSAAPVQVEADRAKPFRGPGMDYSLLVGRAGLGRAWLQLAGASQERGHLEEARRVGDELLDREPGPFCYLLSGAAGEGLFLLQLWEATQDERYLAGATRYGAWLAPHAVRDAYGTTWAARDAQAVPPAGTKFAGGGNPPSRYLGLGVGVAGVGYFLARLQQAAPDRRWAGLTREAADTLAQHAMPDRGGMNWESEPLGAAESRLRYQWCRGSTGVGLFFAEAYRALGHPEDLRLAEAAGEATYSFGDGRHNPSLCHGLSGNAQLFLELHQLTEQPLWLDRACEFARQAMSYRTATPAGDAWQADEPDSTSPDYMCGAAGAGQFFLQLLAPDRVRFALR
jgi:lantibiotic modifying enzyme